MAKDKAKKGVPNKHLHARITYLHKAASYLTAQSLSTKQNSHAQPTPGETQDDESAGKATTMDPSGTLATDAQSANANSKPAEGCPSTATFNTPPSGLPVQLTAHLRSVAQKAQIRLSQDLKHAFCRVCSSPFVEGETCIRSTENLSKGGRKPWADVLVVKCCACGACRRFPVGAKKQKRKALRASEKANSSHTSGEASDDGPTSEPMALDKGTTTENEAKSSG